MPVGVAYSNHLPHLAARMQEQLRQDFCNEADYFQAPRIVIPNTNLKMWLQMQFASSCHVAFHLNFVFLEDALFAQLLPDLPKGSLRLSQDVLQKALLQVLTGLDCQRPEFSPLRNYFLSDEEQVHTQAGKMWQLSERLAALFLQYELNRPQMVEAWLSDRLLHQDANAEAAQIELCQAALYRRAREFLAQGGKNYLGYLELLQASNSIRNFSNNYPLYFFGLSHISLGHYLLLQSLSQCMDLHFYCFNPCMEYWEDVKTVWEQKRFLRRKGLKSRQIRHEAKVMHVQGFAISELEEGLGHILFDRELDNRLLQWWGRSGRENIRLLNRLASYDFEELYDLPLDKESVLACVQAMLLTRDNLLQKGLRIPQDRSLQVIGAPTLFREVESVKQSILRAMLTDETLKFTDIAVLVVDMQSYRPVILSVFAQDRSVPFNLVDSSASQDSVYAHAVLQILNILQTPMHRQNVLELLENPCVASRFQLSVEDVNAFRVWIHELGAHLESQSSGFSWTQAIHRLILGRYLQSDQESHYFELIPYEDMSSSDARLLGAFLMILEPLLLARSSDRISVRSYAEWTRDFVGLCDQLLQIPEQLRAEATVRNQLVQALQGFVQLESETGSGPVEFSLFAEVVKNSLKGFSSGIGAYLVGGVTFAELHPMRPVPFRIVYIMGLQEGSFPRSEPKSSLDLRLLRRSIGDVSLAERNQYLFLEVLSATREKLILTYQDRDMIEGRALLPCSVILQLIRFVEEEILPEGETFQRVQIPLLSNQSLEHFKDSKITDFPACYDRFSQRFYRPQPSDAVGELPAQDMRCGRIRITDLVEYLMDPGIALIKRGAGIYLGATHLETGLLADCEPFIPNRFDALAFAVQTAAEQLLDPNAAQGVSQRISQLQRLRKWPEGVYQTLSEGTLQQMVTQILNSVTAMPPQFLGLTELPVCRELTIAETQTFIEGTLPRARMEGDTLILATTTLRKLDKVNVPREAIHGFVSAILNSATNLDLCLVGPDMVWFRKWTALPSLEWLQGVVHDFVNCRDLGRLPLQHKSVQTLLETLEASEEELAALRLELDMEPVSAEAQLARLRVVDGILEILRQRIGPLWKALI